MSVLSHLSRHFHPKQLTGMAGVIKKQVGASYSRTGLILTSGTEPFDYPGPWNPQRGCHMKDQLV